MPAEPVLNPTRHAFTIEGWRPCALNELLRQGPWGARWRKRIDRDHVAIYARVCDVPPAIGRRRVSLVVAIPPGQRRWDADALWKSLLDALVHARLLVDDGPKWCELGDVRYERTDHLATMIILEEIP